jgi:carbonic anhydrase
MPDPIDELLASNARYAAGFGPPRPGRPARELAVVTCMDARIDAYRLLGLGEGEAHVLRNAGGIVSDDVLRSLTISQRLLGTRMVLVIHHTRCGMLGLADDEFRRELRSSAGAEPDWTPGGFSDLDEDVRGGVARIRDCPFLPHTDEVHGFVADVDTGLLRRVC